MEVQVFTNGKITVKHVTENNKNIVKVETKKTNNAVFYRGSSSERAKKTFSELIKALQNKIFG